MRELLPCCLIGGAILAGGCASAPRGPAAPAEATLRLQRVVLYRSGVGYFERGGTLAARELRLRCRKDQINDILKSLTVIDRRSGRAISLSLPLDPQRWTGAAGLLGPGHGSLAQLLDSLRGARVELRAQAGSFSGRVLLVEDLPGSGDPRPAQVSLLDGDRLRVVPLNQVSGVQLLDGEVAQQIHRGLDAAAGEGVLRQVDIGLRLADGAAHDLTLSYVASAAVWQPSYRLVLPEAGDGSALLQAWAVVANHSGEDWRDVRLTLTAGAPTTFRYDLHTPREVIRPDLTSRGHAGRAAAGEPSAEREAPGPEAPQSVPAAAPSAAPPPVAKKPPEARGEADPALSQRSAPAQASAQPRPRAGQALFELHGPVTVPDGTSTMVTLLSQAVPAEQALLYRPGGGGAGYEANPYRVVRFKNRTPFVLEPGPISVYAGGSFVGEGLAEPIAAEAGVIIPFSVEPGVVVHSARHSGTADERALALTGGNLLIESALRQITRYTVRGPRTDRPYRVLLRHPRAGGGFNLRPRPPETEDLPDAYLIPLVVPAGPVDLQAEVIEQRPQRTTMALWDPRAEELLGVAVAATGGLDAAARERLAPVLSLRRDMTRIDGELAAQQQQRQALDQRAKEARANLEALKKDPSPGANALRERLTRQLEGLTREGEALARKTAELTRQRLERKVRLEEKVQGLNLRFADPGAPDATAKAG